MVSKYNYLIIDLDFSHLGFCSGNFFLSAPFLDHCQIVPLNELYEALVCDPIVCYNLKKNANAVMKPVRGDSTNFIADR